MKIGEDYEEAKRVVIVAIVDFEIDELKEIDEMETKWKLIETKNREKILTELLEINIISLKKAIRRKGYKDGMKAGEKIGEKAGVEARN